MNDIFDINELYFQSRKWLFLSLFVFFTALITYSLSKYFKFNNKNKEVIENKIETKIDFEKEFLEFEKNIYVFSSKDFLQQISFLFKSYLEQEWNHKNITKMTLDELYWYSIDENSLSILNEIYYLEYRDLDVNFDKRSDIFSNIKKIVFKNKN